METRKVPTGHICIINGDLGKPLEFLSIGDYGKEQNVKAEFLGLTKEIEGVSNGSVMPLEEKWVITISTQYGCSMGCTFCDVPKVGPGINATSNDLFNQIEQALMLHPEVKHTKRLNIHYARMGEPTFNADVLSHAKVLKKITRHYLGDSIVHPVISTMLPKNNRRLYQFILEWCFIKNTTYLGNAGLQFSINSTSDFQRKEMFSGSALTLEEISTLGNMMPYPIGRKYALNFALADEYEIDAAKLRTLFNPDKFMVKITPMHLTDSCIKNNIKTTGGYEYFTPYKQIERELIEAGFDDIVFIPSFDEDESKITCGNAILAEGRVWNV